MNAPLPPALLQPHPATYIGVGVARPNARRLLAGRGAFVDDLRLPRELHAVFVRSPHAHARIVSIDLSAARADVQCTLLCTRVELGALTMVASGAASRLKSSLTKYSGPRI